MRRPRLNGDAQRFGDFERKAHPVNIAVGSGRKQASIPNNGTATDLRGEVRTCIENDHFPRPLETAHGSD
jgi:hypothetical protein